MGSKIDFNSLIVVGGLVAAVYFINRAIRGTQANPENVASRTERIEIRQSEKTIRQENRQDFWKDILTLLKDGNSKDGATTKNGGGGRGGTSKIPPGIATSSWTNSATQSVMSERGKNLITSSGYGASAYDALGQGISTRYTSKSQATSKTATRPKTTLGKVLKFTAPGRIVYNIRKLTARN